jgi:MFS family permease
MSLKQEKNLPAFWPILMLITVGIAYFFSNFHRFSLGVISAGLAAEFNLDSIKLGLLGSALFYSYAIMQIPSGLLTDKLGSRLIMTLSCLLTTLATLLFASATGFPALFTARTLTGLAVAFIYVPALAIVREWFDEKIFSTMTGVLVALGQMGALSTSVPLYLLTTNLGWRSTFRIIAFISLALSVLIFIVVRSKARPPKSDTPAPGILKSSNKVLIKPDFWSFILFFFIYGGVQFSFQGLWGARFFDLALGRENERAALLMAISCGCVAGAMLLGILADRLGRFRVLSGAGFAMSLLWFSMAYFGFSTNGIILYLLCFVLGVLGAGGYTVAFSTVRYFATGGNGSFLSGINGCAGFLGSAIFTQMVGVFFNFSKTDVSAGFRTIFLIFATLCVLSTILMMRLNKGLFKR